MRSNKHSCYLLLIMKNFFRYTIYVLIVYIFVHNPLLTLLHGIGAVKVLYLFTIVVAVTAYSAYNRIISFFYKELRLLLVMYFYILICTLVGPYESNFAYRGLVLLIEEFFVPLAIVLYFRRTNVSYQSFIRIILIVGVIGALVSSVCLFVPSINDYFKTFIVVVQQDSYLANALFRGYGISDELTYSYGIVQGFIFSIGLLNLKNEKWFLFFMPLIILSILVNARTGFLFVLLGVVLYIVSNHISKSVLLGGIMTLVVVYLLPTVIPLIAPQTMDWISDFFSEIGLIFRNKNLSESSTLNTLAGQMAIWPDNLFQWVFGRGYYMVGRTNETNTDVGWFLQLNLGGVVYILLLFSLLLSLYKKLKSQEYSKCIVFLYIGAIVIANTKGDFLYNSGSFRMLLLFVYYTIISYKHCDRISCVKLDTVKRSRKNF